MAVASSIWLSVDSFSAPALTERSNLNTRRYEVSSVDSTSQNQGSRRESSGFEESAVSRTRLSLSEFDVTRRENGEIGENKIGTDKARSSREAAEKFASVRSTPSCYRMRKMERKKDVGKGPREDLDGGIRKVFVVGER
jgi:hypothetical protein